jgi:hypothetical protein
VILLDGTSTAEAPTNPAEEEGRSHLKKLEAAFAEANDDLERRLTRREDVDSARLKVATESQKILAAVEYERLPKSTRVRVAELLEREEVYSQHYQLQQCRPLAACQC